MSKRCKVSPAVTRGTMSTVVQKAPPFVFKDLLPSDTTTDSSCSALPLELDDNPVVQVPITTEGGTLNGNDNLSVKEVDDEYPDVQIHTMEPGLTDPVGDDVYLIETWHILDLPLPYYRTPPERAVIKDITKEFKKPSSGDKEMSSSTVYIQVATTKDKRPMMKPPCGSVTGQSGWERLAYNPELVYCCDAHTTRLGGPTGSTIDTSPCMWRCAHMPPAKTIHMPLKLTDVRLNANGSLQRWIYGTTLHEWPLRDVQARYQTDIWKQLLAWMQPLPLHMTPRHLCISSGRRQGRSRCLIRMCKLWKSLYPDSTILCLSLTVSHARRMGGRTIWELLGITDVQHVEVYNLMEKHAYEREQFLDLLKRVDLIVMDDANLWSRQTLNAMMGLILPHLPEHTRWLVSESMDSEYIKEYSKATHQNLTDALLRSPDLHILTGHGRPVSVQLLGGYLRSYTDAPHIFDTIYLPTHIPVSATQRRTTKGPRIYTSLVPGLSVLSVPKKTYINPAVALTPNELAVEQSEDTLRRISWLCMFSATPAKKVETSVVPVNLLASWSKAHQATDLECYYYPRIVETYQECQSYNRQSLASAPYKTNIVAMDVAATLVIYKKDSDGTTKPFIPLPESPEKRPWTCVAAKAMDIDMSVTLWPGARVRYVGRRAQAMADQLGTVIFVPRQMDAPVLVLWDSAVMAEDLDQRRHEASQLERPYDRVFWENDMCKMYMACYLPSSGERAAGYVCALIKYMPLRLAAAITPRELYEMHLPGCIVNPGTLGNPSVCESLSVALAHPELVRVRVPPTMVLSGDSVLSDDGMRTAHETPPACYTKCRCHV